MRNRSGSITRRDLDLVDIVAIGIRRGFKIRRCEEGDLTARTIDGEEGRIRATGDRITECVAVSIAGNGREGGGGVFTDLRRLAGGEGGGRIGWWRRRWCRRGISATATTASKARRSTETAQDQKRTGRAGPGCEHTCSFKCRLSDQYLAVNKADRARINLNRAAINQVQADATIGEALIPVQTIDVG